MKKILLLAVFTIIGAFSFGQSNFYQVKVENMASKSDAQQIIQVINKVAASNNCTFKNEGNSFIFGTQQILNPSTFKSKLLKAGYTISIFVDESEEIKKLMIDYPNYINTGNNEKDKQQFEQARQKWIADHPTKYYRIKAIESHQLLLTEPATNEYPKYIDTGNPELDDENYARAKREWIKNHPEASKALDVEKEIITQEEYKQASEEKKAFIDTHPHQFIIKDK